jgi:hypothetical protein
MHYIDSSSFVGTHEREFDTSFYVNHVPPFPETPRLKIEILNATDRFHATDFLHVYTRQKSLIPNPTS